MPCTVEHEKRGTWHSVLEPNRYAEDADDVDVDGDDVDGDGDGPRQLTQVCDVF